MLCDILTVIFEFALQTSSAAFTCAEFADVPMYGILKCVCKLNFSPWPINRILFRKLTGALFHSLFRQQANRRGKDKIQLHSMILGMIDLISTPMQFEMIT